MARAPRSLIVVATYCRPSCLYPRSHSWQHSVCFKWKHRSYPEFMSVKGQRKMTLPVHQGQRWWGGSLQLETQDRMSPPVSEHLSHDNIILSFTLSFRDKLSFWLFNYRQMIVNVSRCDAAPYDDNERGASKGSWEEPGEAEGDERGGRSRRIGAHMASGGEPNQGLTKKKLVNGKKGGLGGPLSDSLSFWGDVCSVPVRSVRGSWQQDSDDTPISSLLYVSVRYCVFPLFGLPSIHNCVPLLSFL